MRLQYVVSKQQTKKCYLPKYKKIRMINQYTMTNVLAAGHQLLAMRRNKKGKKKRRRNSTMFIIYNRSLKSTLQLLLSHTNWCSRIGKIDDCYSSYDDKQERLDDIKLLHHIIYLLFFILLLFIIYFSLCVMMKTSSQSLKKIIILSSSSARSYQ